MAQEMYGTRMEYGDGATHAASSSWTAFSTVVGVEMPDVEAEDIDTTHLLSADEFREYLPGLAEGSEITFKLQYAPTQQTTVYGFFRTLKGYRIRFADDSGWKVTGYLKKIKDEGENGGIIETTCVIKITGKPVFDETLLS